MTQTQSTTSGLTCLVGSEDALALRTRRAELIAATGTDSSQIQRINLSEEHPTELLMAVSAPSLFGGARVVVVDHFEAFPKELQKELAESLGRSDAVVIATTSKPVSKAAASEMGATVEKVGEPKGRAIAGAITELAERWGVTLSKSAVGKISKGGVGDWDALNDALSQLADLGVTTPGRAEMGTLEAAASGQPAPWDLSDAIEAGDAAKAVRVLERRGIAAFATFAYLANRIRDLTMVQEEGCASPEEVQKLCGIGHPFPAKKLLELSRRTRTDAVARMWEVIAETELRLRSESDPDRTLEEAVVALARAAR